MQIEALKIQQMLLERELYDRERSVRRRVKTEKLLQSNTTAKRIEDIINEKKQRFLDTPSISFHFADKEQIQNFYNDYFKEPTLESLVSEISGETNGQIKASIPQVVESKIGSKDISKWISTIKLPDTSLAGMFLRYQRETIKSEQVTLGIEEVDIELTELQEFEQSIQDLDQRFAVKLDTTLLDSIKAKLKEKAAEKTLVKLEQATGWVLIEGRFKIARDGDFYQCTYTHPVNEYLPMQSSHVTISVLVEADRLEPRIAGNYAQSVGKLIPLKIYGKVWQPIDRKTST
jgi:hypothetical protein